MFTFAGWRLCIIFSDHYSEVTKMNIRKLICAILALAMIFALAACGEKKADDEDGGDGSEYTVFSEGLDENGYFQGVRALDNVTLPDIGSITFVSLPQVTDRAVEDRDFVNIDYVGSTDGVEFSGGSTQGMGTDVIIGVTSYIDDFLQQIIGHKPGENFDIEVTFPDNYGETSLAGKDATFNITVNYIWDVTDESATAMGFDGRDGMAQYMAGAGASVKDVLDNYNVGAYLTAAECDAVPDSVTGTTKSQLMEILKIQAAQNGMDADALASYYGSSSAEEYVDSQAQSRSTWNLIFQAVAEQEGVTATDEDITQRQFEGHVEVYGLPYVKFTILQDKVIEFILSHVE